jgi:hypothetical protein
MNRDSRGTDLTQKLTVSQYEEPGPQPGLLYFRG